MTLNLPIWVAAKGAAKFARGWAEGDRADNDTISYRRDVCKGCPQLHDAYGSDWCGPPFKEIKGVCCGCMLAGKTSIGSERCPQGKW